MNDSADPFRSGFIGLVGRPNTGKSTLLNALCGEKLSITSEKPQTTRNRILGVRHLPGAQMVFVDTPGLQLREKAINRYMRQVAEKAASDADVIVYLVDPTRDEGSEEAATLGVLAPLAEKVPVVLAVNKADLDRGKAEKRREGMALSFPFAASLTLSALTGEGVELLVGILSSLLPEGVPYFPPGMVTDQPLSFVLAELVRERLFSLTHQEIPYATAVVVEDLIRREDGLVEISATIYVEKESQKGIVIGKGGAMLRKVGAEARREMERRLGAKVFLRLWVKVKAGWTGREDLLRQLGYR